MTDVDMPPAAGSDPEFAAAVKDLGYHIGSLGEAKAAAFLDKYPIKRVFEILSTGELEVEVVDNAVVALQKVLSTSHGTSLLPSVAHYAVAALGSPSAAVRKLGCAQLQRLISGHGQVASRDDMMEIDSEGGTPGAAAALAVGAVAPLVVALRDDDISVSSEAATALEKLSWAESGRRALLDPSSGLAALLAPASPSVVQARALALVAAVAGASAEATTAVESAGLVDPLEAQLKDPRDVLMAMAALESIGELLERGGAVAALLLPRLARPLETLIIGEESDENVRSAAISAAARLLARPLEGPLAHAHTGAAILLGALRGVATQAVEASDDSEAKLLDSLGVVGERRHGAEVVCTAGLVEPLADAALGGRVLGPRRLAALHSLATVAGAERQESGDSQMGRKAEDKLREAVYAAAAGGRKTPAEALWGLVQNPFMEERVAAYRVVVGLGMRVWGAAELCGHAGMLSRLTDAKSETGRAGAEWRHAAASALAFTAASAANAAAAAPGGASGDAATAALVEAVARLQAAARGGPYGNQAGGQATAIPHSPLTMAPGGG